MGEHMSVDVNLTPVDGQASRIAAKELPTRNVIVCIVSLKRPRLTKNRPPTDIFGGGLVGSDIVGGGQMCRLTCTLRP